MAEPNQNTDRNALTITRVFDAPREPVWQAWTEPEHLRRWWGPKGFTSPVCRIDLRVGGAYLYCMRSPEGRDFWSTGVYREIVPLERLVCTDSFADEKGNVVPASHYGMSSDFPLELQVTVTFEEHDGKTKLTVTDLFDTAEDRDGMLQSGMEEGAAESQDRLAELLADLSD